MTQLISFIFNHYFPLSLQYDNLDEEHKGLFDGVFACAGAPSDKAKFDSLCSLVKTHFANEEVRNAKSHAHNIMQMVCQHVLEYYM